MTDFDRDDEATPQGEPTPPTPPADASTPSGAGPSSGAWPSSASTPPDASTPPGAPHPRPPSAPPPSAPRHGSGMSGQDQRNWAAGAHLSALVLAFFGGMAVIGPLVVYLLKKDQDAYVAEHSREALNFQLTWLIGGFVLGFVGVVLALVTIGLGLLLLVPLGIGLFVAWIVFTIKGGLAASRGEYYRYPLTVRMVS